MNLSILISSLNYLTKFQLIVSLSTWLYQELMINKYTDIKLVKSFKNNDLQIAESIIHLNKDKYTFGRLMVFHATEYEKIKLLLQSGADIHICEDYVLRTAVKYRNIKLIKLALEYGADINIKRGKVLSDACFYGDLELVKLFLEANADPFINAEYPLIQAATNGHAEVIKLILEKDVDIKPHDYYGIRIGVSRKYPDIVKLFLDHKASLFQKYARCK